MSGKVKFPRVEAIAVAKDLCAMLKPLTARWTCASSGRSTRASCGRLIVAGSLRRRRAEVGDVEIVYVPSFRESALPASDLFKAPGVERVNMERESIRGTVSWGPSNKLAVHVASGMPVDLFATTEEAWFNYLVCRTGGQVTNTRIASAALAKGWKWHPTGTGFEKLRGLAPETFTVRSERDVFAFVGMKYLEPWERA